MSSKYKRKAPINNSDESLNLDPGDNTKYLTVSMVLASLPKIDIHDPAQVEKRIGEFFKIHADNDLKPTVAGLCLALGNGITRQVLWAMKADKPTGGNGYYAKKEIADLVKKAYQIMENLWENYMQNGKINPVAGIFLGKNHYAYRDQTEYVVSPVGSQDAPSIEDIKARYAIEGEKPATLCDSGSDSDGGSATSGDSPKET